MYVGISNKEDYLAHHGIKGQKWGVENGPPYPLSRQKVNLGEAMRKRKKAKLQEQNAKLRKKNSAIRKKNKEIEENKRLADRQKQLKKESKQLKKGPTVKTSPEPKQTKIIEKKTKPSTNKNLSKKDIRKMSDEEIKTYIDRLQLEKRLYDLDNETMVTGKKVVGDILKKSGRESIEAITKTVFTGAGKYAVKKMIANASSEEVANEIMGGGQKKKKES